MAAWLLLLRLLLQPLLSSALHSLPLLTRQQKRQLRQRARPCQLNRLYTPLIQAEEQATAATDASGKKSRLSPGGDPFDPSAPETCLTSTERKLSHQRTLKTGPPPPPPATIYLRPYLAVFEGRTARDAAGTWL